MATKKKNKANPEPKTIEEWADYLSSQCELAISVKHQSKNVKYIQVDDQNPDTARRWFATKLLPRLGLDFAVPRKTKKTGFLI